MKIGIVTPFCTETLEVIVRCLRSVQRQQGEHLIDHFLIGDGSPHHLTPPASVMYQPRVVNLGRVHGDMGNAARAVGAILAAAEGCDAVGFLDADNWLGENHCNRMAAVAEHNQDAGVIVATRTMHRPDGSAFYIDHHDSDGDQHVDTNCMFVLRSAFYLLPIWGQIPKGFEKVADRVIWPVLRGRCIVKHEHLPTVHYTTRYRIHYEAHGEPPPPDAKPSPVVPTAPIRLVVVQC